ncbi:unnamed protein product [Rhizoctonia solani]|uniref:Peptidase C14 caspase domain-containing protein n=1 Tax=Rhizoctonia solani TaxID=456999 RepID=A0A8H3B4K0_9AGAM|nr:unnamed protein product [Rhizoctonia solani]
MSYHIEVNRIPGGEDRGRPSHAVAATLSQIPDAVLPAVNNEEIVQSDVTLPNGTTAFETISNRTSRLHALIIGINNYPNLPKLKGAVADADEVTELLVSELQVLPEHIINLREGAATRQEIIDSIKSLQSNPQINKGDPILIYYAGHGGVRKATEVWKGEHGAHIVQVIFPFDYDTKANNSSDPIQCIPDRTIAGLLNDLSDAKGDNITVIFDSCHSASGTRELSKPKKGVLDRRERSAEVKYEIPWDIDREIVRPERGVVPPPKDNKIRHTNLPLCANQTSHIHLAACGSEEKAYEENGRGLFTMALLKSIRAHGVDKITYHGLIKSLPSLSSQSPHCYGKHKERILFNSDVPSQRTLMIPVEFNTENKEIVLQAGAASGVTTKSIWEIYNTVTGEVSLGTFRAESPYVSTTVLKPEEDGKNESLLAYLHEKGFGTRTYARQVAVGVVDELRVYFTPRAKERIFPTDESTGTASYSVGSGKDDVGYVVHGAVDSADIAVDHDDSDGRVSFRLCDRQAEQYGVATLVNRVRAERSAVEEVLFGAAKWKWHLQRKNTDSWITDLVKMELISVGERSGMHKKMFPEEERKSVNTSGIADFEVKRQHLYGVKLTSQVNRPLHVRMFYFDTTDFSIVDMFGHSTGKDAVIKPEGTFTIGDRAEGGTPLQFTLNKDEKLDLGYLKVFWSTEPLEMEGLEQKPAFNRESRKWSRLRGCKLFVNEGVEWGTMLLSLVQRLPDPPPK